MNTNMNTNSDTVQAALHYVNPDRLTMDQWAFANAEMDRQIIENDRNRGADRLAAAARILAAEVERLRAGQQQKSIALSDCCEAVAVVAGKPNSTQWYVCPQCCQPCDVFYQDKNTQPQ